VPRTDWQSLGITAAAPFVPRWRALQAQASVMSGPTWSLTLAEAFGLPLEAHVWQPGGELAAVVPLVRGDGWRRAWSAPLNEHIPAAAFAVGGDAERLAGELLEQLLRRTDMVVLDRFPLDGALGRALVAAARRRGAPVIEQRAEGGDCFLRLDAAWPEVRARLSAHNGKENERKRRQLERTGRLEFAAHRSS
jgi:hypothetical protein